MKISKLLDTIARSEIKTVLGYYVWYSAPVIVLGAMALVAAHVEGWIAPALTGVVAGVVGISAAVAALSRKTSSRVSIRPPCHLTMRVLKFLLTRKTFERLVIQIIADGREEYFEALQAGRVWHARYIGVRTHFILFFSLFFSAFTSTFAKVFSAAWKAVVGPG